MKLLEWTPAQSRLVLAAMTRVATEDGRTPPSEIDTLMIACCQEHVFHTSYDLAALPDVSAEDLAAALPDAAHRVQAVTLLTIAVYSATEMHPRRADVVQIYAEALDVRSDAVRYLREMREGQIRRLKLDYLRGMLAAGIVPGDGLWQKLGAIVQVLREPRGDAAVARRFQALEKLPQGTLGRAFFEFYRLRGYPLPGEPGCIPEGVIAVHDLTHILTGFNTDRSSEIAVVTCQAGYMQKHPYEMILDGLTSFHMGLLLDAQLDIPPAKGHLDPHLMMIGLERGLKMTTDLMAGWDYGAVLDQPVDVLRERYGIAGADDVWLDPPPPDPDDRRRGG